MSKKFAVRSLNELALSELANCIVATFGISMQIQLDDMTLVMVEINSYLSEAGATSDIYQDLLKIILGSDYLEASIRFICLQTLLNESVQHLVTEIFPFSYYDRILQVIALQGTGLRALNLKGVWIKEEQMFAMHEIIKKLPYLTRLSIPYIANDELLQELAEHCRNLKILDVSGKTDITEIGVEALSLGLAQNNLQVVDIGMLGEESICHTDIALLLLHLPNLTNLITYSFVGKSLQYIHEEKNSNFKCKLKYIHDTGTTSKAMDAIVNSCPELESIYIDTPVSGIVHKLAKLKLKQLKLYKFSCNELLDLVTTTGDGMVHLTLIKGKGVLDVGQIMYYCSNLLNLDCYMMEQLTYTFSRNLYFLQGLEILNSPFSKNSLKKFICNSTNLKRLAVDSVIFDDDDMVSIFLENDFLGLEDIWFTSAVNLTMSSVEILMERCPELQSLGQLSGWSLTPDDLALLRGILKSGNSCLVLSPTSLFP